MEKRQFAEWLGREHPDSLFCSQHEWWWLYRRSLVPANVGPRPTTLEQSDAIELLRSSGAYLLRYFTRTFDSPTDFWWVACDTYAPSKKARNQIRRAHRTCTVQSIDAADLEKTGFACYKAAHNRYKNSSSFTEGEFVSWVHSHSRGPFEWWGAFVQGELAGFTLCGVDRPNVGFMSMKLHPDFLAHYPAYALIDAMLESYVVRDGLSMNNGFRSISHDTEMQGFLDKFGFRRHYCDLKVIYRRPFSFAVNAVYPFRRPLSMIPRLAPLNALLFQERICRSFR
jgi:hypothetical protein